MPALPPKKYKIKDIGQVVGGGTPSTSNPEYYGGTIPWLSPKDLSNHIHRYISHGEKNITALGLANSSAKIMPAGTILMSSRAPIGYLAIAANDICTNQGFKSIVPNIDMVDSEYLYYYLKYHIEEIKSLGVGTTFAEISGKLLENYEVELPELILQKRVSSIISAIDSKIELNQTINDNLSRQCQTIFDAMIVDGKVESELRLTDIANFQNGLPMQKNRPQNGMGLPVLKIKELNQGYCDESSERCREDIKQSVLINDGDVVFSWSGSLMAKIWCGGKCGLNQHLFKVTSDQYPLWFYYGWLQHHMPHFIEIAANKATTMGHICRNHIEDAVISYPPKSIMKKVDSILSPLYNEQISLMKEINQLGILRDYVLSRLMSGEIDVSAIELPTKYSFDWPLSYVFLMRVLYILLINHGIMERRIYPHMT